MPELPEVETTRRSVAPCVVGQRIAKLIVYDRRLRWPVPGNLAKRLEGRTVDGISRRSKYLLFRIGAGSLLVHLGMTGSLRVHTSAPVRRPHDHVDIVFDGGTVLRYHDPRRFGAMLWAPDPALSHPLLRDLGPEPFDAAFDADYLWRATRSRTAAIKLALMDSHLVVGVGNIYANESLFRAGIRPTSRANKVSRPRLARLVDAGAGRADRGHRQGRQHASGLCRRGRRARLLPARLLRVRPRGPTVPDLRQSDPAPPAGSPGFVLLSRLPALTASGKGRRGWASLGGPRPSSSIPCVGRSSRRPQRTALPGPITPLRAPNSA